MSTAGTTRKGVTMEAAGVAAWVERYVRAWNSNDPDEIGGLFTQAAEYRHTPFAEPWQGRDEIVRQWLARRDAPAANSHIGHVPRIAAAIHNPPARNHHVILRGPLSLRLRLGRGPTDAHRHCQHRCDHQNLFHNFPSRHPLRCFPGAILFPLTIARKLSAPSVPL